MKRIAIILLILVTGLLLAGVLIFQTEKRVKEGGEKKMAIGKRVLMVLAPQDFRDEEYQEPRKVLEENGVLVIVASKGVREAEGMFGTKALVEKDINQVKVDDYDAVIFIGGVGASIYFNDQTALGLAESAFEKGKIVAAICIAPSILANAGILSGKNVTSFPSEEANLKAKGVNYTGEAVTVDGKILTARGPEAAEEFGKKLVEVLRSF